MTTDYDPFDPIAREELDADRKAAAELERINEVNDFQWLMGSKRGRRIVCRLLAKTGLYRSSFNNSGSVTAFNEGQRNFGLMLMAMIEANCADQYFLMLQEKNT